MGAEYQRLFDVGRLRRARHETPVGEVPDFGAHDGFVHRIDQRIARDEDHQGRGTEIEGFVADILPDPYRAVFRHAEAEHITALTLPPYQPGRLPGPSWKSNLGRGLALRCFQRLSFPYLATRRCR